MTDDLEDSSQWRGSVETRMGTLETAAVKQEAALQDQADLRAAMDSDMGELKAEFRPQRSMLQALHDTQQEHTVRLTRLETGQDQLRAGQDELRTKLDLVHVGVKAIHTLLTGLTASGTDEDNDVSANPVDADPDALP
jgi:chromosome segregation ATPase